MKTTIRPALECDAPMLAELSLQLGYPTSAEEVLSRIKRLKTSPDHAILVAEQSGPVRAWIHVQRRASLESPDYAEITGMVVDEDCRGQGLGARLVDAAEAWGRRQGLQTLRVRSNVVRTRTHAFYERLGFGLAKSQKVFQKDLPLEP
jgi:GNAT superfamily N-acetyltransferase